MKTLFTTVVILILSITVKSQTVNGQKSESDKWFEVYKDTHSDSYDYIKIADEVGWIPSNDGIFKGSKDLFEKVMLKMNGRAFQQMDIDGQVDCMDHHQFLMERYNKKYKPVSQEVWDKNCPLLCALMRIDI